MEEKGSEKNAMKVLIETIRLELTDYVDTRLKLFRLEAIEKSSIIGSYAVYGLIVAFVLLLITIFLLATLAIVITVLTKNLLIGFVSVTSLVLIALLILLLNGKAIRNKMTNAVISIIMKAGEDE